MLVEKLRVRSLGVSLCLMAGTALAQSALTEHTYALDDPANSPRATLADVSWLAGTWTGTAFGGQFEEVWNPPSAGTMVGLYKLMHGARISLYELMLIAEERGTLVLKVKHFNADFSAWEEKTGFVDLPLVGLEPTAIHFAGLSFHRVGADEMRAYLATEHDGVTSEAELIYQRRR